MHARPPSVNLPRAADLDTQRIWTLLAQALEELLTVSAPAWREELTAVGAYLGEFGDRVPPALTAELEDALARVNAS